MKRESKISQEILKYIESNGGYVVNIIKANKSGVPDLICGINGRFIGIEVKKEKGGVVSELQKYNIRKIKEAGCDAFIARSLNDVKIFLEERHDSN